MKKYLNKIMGLSLTAIMVLGMTGCGSSNTDETNTSVKNTAASSTTANTTSNSTDNPSEKPLTEGEKLAQQYTGFIETPMDLGGRTIHIVGSVSSFQLANDLNGNPSREATSNEVAVYSRCYGAD